MCILVLAGLLLSSRRLEVPSQVLSVPKLQLDKPQSQARVAESVSGRLADAQLSDLQKIGSKSFLELVGMVRNMTATQRQVMAKRLSERPGNLAEISNFFRAWAAVDSNAAFIAGADFSNPSQKEAALRASFDGAEPKDAGKLVDLLRTLQPGTLLPGFAQELLNTGLSKWSMIDPASAAGFIRNYEARNAVGQDTYREIGKNWGKSDPRAAFAWESQQEGADLKQQISAGILQGWVATNPQEAARFAQSHIHDGASGSEGAAYSSVVANYLAVKDPPGARQFVEDLPLETQPSAAVSAAMQLAHDDPQAAAAWINELPEETQIPAAGAVASQFAIQDPGLALSWIDSLSGNVKDSALSTFATNARDRGAGMAAAFRITDTGIRSSVVKTLADQWNLVNPAGLQEWLSTSGLPVETQKALLSGGH